MPYANVLVPADITAARRRRLQARLAGAGALFAAGRAPERTPTIAYAFRPDSDFFYLTGLREPEAVLWVGREATVAFVRPRDRAAEGWTGRRLGVEEAPAALGVDAAYPLDELVDRLPELAKGHEALCYGVGGALDAAVLPLVAGAAGPATLVHPRAVLHGLRLVKSEEEIAALRAAAAATAAGFAAAVAAIAPGSTERRVRAALEHGFLARGADGPAYGSIVATGANATVLHHQDEGAPLEAGQLLLIDAGAEVGCYACDVSRTYPVSGAFTPLQRQVVDLVLRAQAAALDALVPGAVADAYHARADLALAEGLVALGVLQGEPAALVAAGRHKPYTRHRAGHFLGLDTHDVGGAMAAVTLAPGMVLTVEPGLYFAPDDEAIPAALRGLGVRIEDVALITVEGATWLTDAIPREPLPDGRGSDACRRNRDR